MDTSSGLWCLCACVLPMRTGMVLLPGCCSLRRGDSLSSCSSLPASPGAAALPGRLPLPATLAAISLELWVAAAMPCIMPMRLRRKSEGLEAEGSWLSLARASPTLSWPPREVLGRACMRGRGAGGVNRAGAAAAACGLTTLPVPPPTSRRTHSLLGAASGAAVPQPRLQHLASMWVPTQLRVQWRGASTTPPLHWLPHHRALPLWRLHWRLCGRAASATNAAGAAAAAASGQRTAYPGPMM